MKRLSYLSALLVCLLLSAASSMAQGVAPTCHTLTAGNLMYFQNFNSLSSSPAGTASSVVSPGFGFVETGTSINNNTTYKTGSGSAISDTFSFGNESVPENLDRSLGSVRGSAFDSTIGSCFINNAGSTIASLLISYDGEQWRLGATGRVDRLDFQYSTNATSLLLGTWIDVNALDFTAPITIIPLGQTDGNDASYRVAGINSTISSLSIPNGGTFYIRYSDLDATGSDDGLAIDNFSLTATLATSITIDDITVTEGNSGTTNAIFTVTRTGDLSATTTVDWATANGTADSADLAAQSGSLTFNATETTKQITVAVNGDTLFETNETYFVNLTNPVNATISDNQGLGTITNDDPIVVNDTGDATDANSGNGICETAVVGICTFRAAIAEANALTGSDIITFSALFNSPQTIILTSGSEIEINSALTINGPGANLLTIDGGAGSNRIFYFSGAVATVRGVTITGGNGIGTASSLNGGAIFANGGTLVLDGVHVTGNSSAGGFGGGAYFFGGINNQIINSTFSANISSGTCGGFVIELTTLAITNSTISGNTATTGGAGFCNNFSSTTTLRNVTIYANTAGAASGGGISNSGSTLDLGSTIVAGNTAGTNPDIHLPTGTITSAGFNLIGINTSVEAAFPAGQPNVGGTDNAGTSGIPLDPGLAPLGNYGGATPTHALQISPLSLAIDKGFAFGSTTDQRGFGRTFDDPSIAPPIGGDNTDIGAYERLSPTAADASISGRVMTADGRGIKGASVTLSSGGPERNIRVITGTFGYYRFDGLRVGETYVLTVGAKRYTFANPSRAVSLDDEVSDADFTALR